MVSPITKVLIKVFAHGFYKVHSGLLLFLFVVIFSHCFWMKPLGGHLTQEQSVFYHLIMLLSFANDPVMMVLVFISWLIYTIKILNYIEKQLKATESQFLFYSFTSLSRFSQFRSWFFVQAIILLPAIVYGLTAVTIGILYQYYLIPVIILVYLLVLISISAMIYVLWTNRRLETKSRPYLLNIFQNWKKPFFSLYIYYVFDRLKVAYVITKILSWLTISGIFNFFSDLKQDFRLAGIVVLMVTVAHTVLIFQNQRFEEVYLGFIRNFPYSRMKIFIGFAAAYSLLTLPESIWIITQFSLIEGSILLLFGLSTALLFRSLLYCLGSRMNKYLPWIFSLFIAFFLVIMFGYFWLLPPLNLTFSYWVFYQNYYKPTLPAKNHKPFHA